MSRTDEAADSETSVTNGCKVIENHQNYLLSGGVFYVFYCILGKIIRSRYFIIRRLYLILQP